MTKKTMKAILMMCIIAMFTIALPVQASAASAKLSAKTLALTVGKSKTLSVKNNKKTVKWSSNKTSVATVSSKGKVTAKKAGTATITAKFGKSKLTCKVTVKKAKAVKVTKVKLNKSKMTLNVKGSYTLTATVSPKNATNKAVTWKSSNTKIATVTKNGKVTAKAKGTAKITATAKDGSKKAATCTVTVKKASSKSDTNNTIVSVDDDNYDNPATSDTCPGTGYKHCWYSTGVVIQPSTCAVKGIERQACRYCSQTRDIQDLPLNPSEQMHTWGAPVLVKKAGSDPDRLNPTTYKKTCTSCGLERTYYDTKDYWLPTSENQVKAWLLEGRNGGYNGNFKPGNTGWGCGAYAYGLDASVWGNYGGQIHIHRDASQLKVGDILKAYNTDGTTKHVQLVWDVQRDASGKATAFRITEANVCSDLTVYWYDEWIQISVLENGIAVGEDIIETRWPTLTTVM